MSKKVSLDFDGVLAHTMDLWISEFNKQHSSKKTSIADVTAWAFFERDPFSINEKEAFELFDFCWRHWELIKPVEVDQWYKVEMLKKICKVDVVTSIVKNKDAIRKWLSMYDIKPDDVVFDQQKWKLDYEVFIDDSPHNAENIEKEGKICLLYNQLWNKNVKETKNIIRVYSLDHAIDVLKSLNSSNKGDNGSK